MEDTQFLPMREAARRVGVTERTLRKRVRSGDIQAFADPSDLRVRLFKASDIDAYAAAPRPIEPGANRTEVSDAA